MRCQTHNLAAGPDGLCVVCRRGSHAPPPEPAEASNVTRVVYVVVGAVFLFVVSIGLTYRVVRDRAIVAETERATRATTATAPPVIAPPPATAVGTAPPLDPSTAQGLAARSVRIIMYTTTWCPHCKRAKTWMRAQNIAYEERDVESSRAYAAELRAINARGSIPTFDIDGEVAIGFEPSRVLAMRDRAAAKKMPR